MKDLTDGDEARLLLDFAWPMLLGNAFQQSYSMVDSVIVGRAIGKSALAAVGASFPILFLILALAIGVTTGFSIVIAQCYGAKDMGKVRRAVDTSYIFLVGVSILITGSGLALSRPFLELLRTPADILPQALAFLRVMFWGAFFLFGYNSVSAILRGLGDSKTPLYFVMASTVLNVLLVMFFVLVLGWGIAGSAWATVIAQGAAFILGLWYLDRSHKLLKLRAAGLEFDWKLLKRSLAIGLPTGGQQIFVAAGMMALTRIVNGFGTDAMAAYTAVGRIDAFAALPAMSLAAAASVFAGQNLGAGKVARVRRGLLAALSLGAAFSIVTTAVVMLWGRPLIALFNPDPGVVAIGGRYFLIVGGFYVVFSGMFVFTGVLRGAGDVLVPMFITVLSLWLVRIPVSAWLAPRLGTDGIWWSVPAAWCVGLALSAAYYGTGRWQRKAALRMPAALPMEGEAPVVT